jgi:hypothetical protein
MTALLYTILGGITALIIAGTLCNIYELAQNIKEGGE